MKQQLCRERAQMDLNPSEYNAARANTTFAVATRDKQAAGRGRGRGRGRGGRRGRAASKVIKVVGAKEGKYSATAEAKMVALREKVAEYQ